MQRDTVRRGRIRQEPPRQTLYPRWGETRPEPIRETHRYGESSWWFAYIVPRCRKLSAGLTVGDAVISVAAIAFAAVIFSQCGPAFDRWLDLMGL
jgi:hypothetical protein